MSKNLSESSEIGIRGEPFHPVEFARMGVTDVWAKYAGLLSFGRGQVLVILDDGCDLAAPEWNTTLPGGTPKVAAGYTPGSLTHPTRSGFGTVLLGLDACLVLLEGPSVCQPVTPQLP